MDLSLLRDIRPLIIEDESDAMNSMFSIFDTVFDIFYTARNGEEGLYRFYKDTPDVIITDLQMPFIPTHENMRNLELHKNQAAGRQTHAQ